MTARLPSTKTIRGTQSGDRPGFPYIIVNFLGTAEIRSHPQMVEYEDVNTDVKASPVIETEWRYSVHAYGDTPTDLLRPLRSAMHLAQINEPLMPGLTIHELSQVRYVPEFVKERWEPRAQVDLFLRGLTRDGFLIDVIEEYSFSISEVA